MTDPVAAPGWASAYPPPGSPAAPYGEGPAPASGASGWGGPAERRGQLRIAAVVVASMTVVGALLGIVWDLWSPPGPAGAFTPPGLIADETESFAAADGRFLVLTGVVGLAFGVGAWWLKRVRGVYLTLALAAGGVLGALVTALIGAVLRGDSPHYTCGTASVHYTCTRHLGLSVQMHGLWFVEGLLAVLAYALFVAFAADDDLGRPDPLRGAAARPSDGGANGANGASNDGANGGANAGANGGANPPANAGRDAGSIEAGQDLHGGGRHGDGAGPAQ